jgi:hypothetical protein
MPNFQEKLLSLLIALSAVEETTLSEQLFDTLDWLNPGQDQTY